MLMIRLQRKGRTNDPAFRIVLLEKERAAKTGRINEQLGTYNPKSKAFSVDGERVKEWVGKGAQLTDSIHNLFINQGVIEGKKVNALPKKTPIKKEEPEATVKSPAAAEAVAVETPAKEAEPKAADALVAAEEPKAEETPAETPAA